MQITNFLTILASVSLALAAPAPHPTKPAQLDSCPGTGISPASASRVRVSFTASGVVPTLIPSIVPQIAVNVNYGSVAVDLGNRLTTLQTLNPPTFCFTRPKHDKPTTKYSLFLVDPDVPGPSGPPILGSPRLNFLHWYVSGITAGTSTGTTITLYEPPTPLSPGEQHRYTFLVYREPAGYIPNVIQAQVRPGFDLLGYTTRGRLLPVLGGNFFNQSLTNGIIT